MFMSVHIHVHISFIVETSSLIDEALSYFHQLHRGVCILLQH